jgi:hypothetical protein
MRSVRTAVAVLAASGALLLVGCTSNPVAAPPPTEPPSTAVTTPAPTPTTPPPTQDAADATPVSVACKKLVPADVAAMLDTDLTLVKGWVPDAGTASARLEDLNGTTCEWTNAVGDSLEVAVAKPGAKDSLALKNDLVERSQSVPTYGGEAYFQVVDHVGQADVFRGRTWLFVRSNRFFEPGDASLVVDSALAGLGFGPKETPAPTDSATVPVPTETPAG